MISLTLKTLLLWLEMTEKIIKMIEMNTLLIPEQREKLTIKSVLNKHKTKETLTNVFSKICSRLLFKFIAMNFYPIYFLKTW